LQLLGGDACELRMQGVGGLIRQVGIEVIQEREERSARVPRLPAQELGAYGSPANSPS
jgi:hypothetical protein